MSVYTTVEREELENFLSNYDVGVLTHFQGISEGIENTNYFVDTKFPKGADSHFVLTIFEHHTLEEMHYYLDLMHHLAGHGVPSANPVADSAGNYVSLFKDKPTALVKRLEGGSIIEISNDQCAQIGVAMGKMHAAGLSFDDQQPNPRGPIWCRQTASELQQSLPEHDLTLLNEEILFQKEHQHLDLPRGVIHADLFRDNTLWNNDKLSGIIDFYYACNDVLLFDLAVTVNDWCCNSDHSLNVEKVKTYLSSYSEYRPLQKIEQKYWGVILRAATLRFWLSRLYDKYFPRPGEITHTKNPDEFKEKLIDRIKNKSEYQYYWINNE